MTASYEIHHHSYDVVVVGAGGSGLRATLGMAEQGLKTACVTRFSRPLALLAAQRRELPPLLVIWGRIAGSGICI